MEGGRFWNRGYALASGTAMVETAVAPAGQGQNGSETSGSVTRDSGRKRTKEEYL